MLIIPTPHLKLVVQNSALAESKQALRQKANQMSTGLPRGIRESEETNLCTKRGSGAPPLTPQIENEVMKVQLSEKIVWRREQAFEEAAKRGSVLTKRQ